jgi:hypothetical protein
MTLRRRTQKHYPALIEPNSRTLYSASSPYSLEVFMSPSPHVPYYVELFVPNAESEQEFLLFAVYAASPSHR